MFALASAVALGADGPPPEKSPAAPGDDAITVAKREFEAVKEARNALSMSPSGALPTIATPELHVETESPTAAAGHSLPGKRDTKTKSTNWLVDGVMKNTDRGARDPAGNVLDNDTTTDGIAPDPDAKPETNRGDRGRDGQDRTANKPVDPVANPLSQFMAGWMTPQDYTLLRPGMNGDVPADRGSRDSPLLPGTAASPSAVDFSGSNLASVLAGIGGAADAPVTPRDNPFLQSFVPPSPQSLLPAAPPPAVSQPSAISPAINPPVQAPPAQFAVPDFAKPSDDAKYFKQLKRF